MMEKVKGRKSSAGTEPADAVATRLRAFYDSLIDEGTPDFLLDLLERLDAVEKAAQAREDKGLKG